MYDFAYAVGFGLVVFQSPNLSGMFNAVEPSHVGAVSGLSLTSANIANAMGVAVGSVLFMRWLNYYGLGAAACRRTRSGAAMPEMFVKSFQRFVDGDRRAWRRSDRHVSAARRGRGRNWSDGVMGFRLQIGFSSSVPDFFALIFSSTFAPSATSATPWPALFL